MRKVVDDAGGEIAVSFPESRELLRLVLVEGDPRPWLQDLTVTTEHALGEVESLILAAREITVPDEAAHV